MDKPFTAKPNDLEISKMEISDASKYSKFFETTVSVLSAGRSYSEQEKTDSIKLRGEKEIEEKIKDPNFVMLAIKDSHGDMIASVECRVVTNPDRKEKMGNIVWILVDPSMRNKTDLQIGSKLLLSLETELKKLGCVGVISGIKIENTESVNFHEKRGFAKEDRPAKPGQAWYSKKILSLR
jgi:ribosomal protein S18 acetylase RimI-like enzyme